MTSPVILVIEPDPIAGLDRFGAWLSECGLDVQIVRPYEGQSVPPIAGYDGMIVLGGRMSAHDSGQYPWLVDVFDRIRDAAHLRTPTMGICLGAQVMAHALGGEVLVDSGKSEVGPVTVRVAEAAADPLLDGLGAEFLVAEDHRDMISRLPAGATRLAGSADYENQVFRVGDVMWGVQFHPEVSVAGFRGWIDDAIRDGSDAASLELTMKQFEAADPVIRENAAIIAKKFAAVVLTQSEAS